MKPELDHSGSAPGLLEAASIEKTEGFLPFKGMNLKVFCGNCGKVF